MSNVPKLRFKEFSGEWALTKIDDVVTLVSGQHLSPEEYQEQSNDLPYFSGPSDFTNDLTDVLKWSLKESKIAHSDDVLITVKGSGVGELFYLHLENVAIGRQLMAIRAKKASSIILYQLLQSRKHNFQALASGNMIPGLSRSDILNQKFYLPAKPEQEKIASFLTSVDTKIEQLTKKEELLKQYKKGVMQKIFSQEIRFKADDDENREADDNSLSSAGSEPKRSEGETRSRAGKEFENWEEKKLGDVATIVGGGTPDTTKEEYWNGKVQWFTPTEIKSKYIKGSNRTITELGLKK